MATSPPSYSLDIDVKTQQRNEGTLLEILNRMISLSVFAVRQSVCYNGDRRNYNELFLNKQTLSGLNISRNEGKMNGERGYLLVINNRSYMMFHCFRVVYYHTRSGDSVLTRYCRTLCNFFRETA